MNPSRPQGDLRTCSRRGCGDISRWWSRWSWYPPCFSPSGSRLLSCRMRLQSPRSSTPLWAYSLGGSSCFGHHYGHFADGSHVRRLATRSREPHALKVPRSRIRSNWSRLIGQRDAAATTDALRGRLRRGRASARRVRRTLLGDCRGRAHNPQSSPVTRGRRSGRSPRWTRRPPRTGR